MPGGAHGWAVRQRPQPLYHIQNLQMRASPLPSQRACMAVPGGAVLFASVNGVHLETPSELQKQAAKQVRILVLSWVRVDY